MKRIEYRLVKYRAAPLKFTGTGHVDMDAFDEDRGHEDVTVLAVFFDEEIEKASRHLLGELDAKYKKENEDFPEEAYDQVDVERVVIEHKPEAKVGIGWFWNEVCWVSNGFDPSEYNWSDTDVHGNPYSWDDDGFLKQIPKPKDFVSAALDEIRGELMNVCRPMECSASEAESYAHEICSNIISLASDLYNPDDEDEALIMRYLTDE